MVTFFLSYFPHFNSKYIDTTSKQTNEKTVQKKREHKNHKTSMWKEYVNWRGGRVRKKNYDGDNTY